MLGRAGVDRLVRPAVVFVVAYGVPGQASGTHHHGARHRAFADPGRQYFSAQFDRDRG